MGLLLCRSAGPQHARGYCQIKALGAITEQQAHPSSTGEVICKEEQVPRHITWKQAVSIYSAITSKPPGTGLLMQLIYSNLGTSVPWRLVLQTHRQSLELSSSGISDVSSHSWCQPEWRRTPHAIHLLHWVHLEKQASHPPAFQLSPQSHPNSRVEGKLLALFQQCLQALAHWPTAPVPESLHLKGQTVKGKRHTQTGNLIAWFFGVVGHKRDHILDTISVFLYIGQDHRGTQSATDNGNAPSFGQTHKKSSGPDLPLMTLS